MTDPFDWLNIDDPAPPKDRRKALQKQRNVARTERGKELIELFRQLDWDQRLWLKALVKNSFNARAARKDLRDKNLRAPEPYKVSRWGNVAEFAKAREMLAEFVYNGEMPTKTMLLLRLNKIAEYNIEEIDEYHQGEPTGRRQMRDVSSALKATEMQGKHLKMFGDEKSGVPEGPMLVVQIISKDDPAKVIDVTPGRVAVARPVIEGESEEIVNGD